MTTYCRYSQLHEHNNNVTIAGLYYIDLLDALQQPKSELSAKSNSINTYTPAMLDITHKSLSALNSTLLIWLLGDKREMEIKVQAL